ncbi:MAG TPA: hypothetical protein VJ622_18855, partial [Acidimicrobiia bacterium]|nr:hypothetical protein [Acidimicrobiia bacterium]
RELPVEVGRAGQRQIHPDTYKNKHLENRSAAHSRTRRQDPMTGGENGQGVLSASEDLMAEHDLLTPGEAAVMLRWTPRR